MEVHSYAVKERIHVRMCTNHYQAILQAGVKVTETSEHPVDEPCTYCEEKRIADMLEVDVRDIGDLVSTFEAVNNARIRRGWMPINHPTDLW